MPTWTAPAIPAGPGSPDYGIDLTINSVAPAAPSAPSFTYTNASTSDITQSLVSISDMASLAASAPAYTNQLSHNQFKVLILLNLKHF